MGRKPLRATGRRETPAEDWSERKKLADRAISLASIGCTILALAISMRALACGWAGDGELREDFAESILMGVDGRPVPIDDDPVMAFFVHQIALGNRYCTGEGVVRNYAEAVRRYRTAAERSLAAAQNNRAAMYEQGFGVERDDEEAARWYRRAAEQGEAQAQHSHGRMYSEGRGVP